MPTLKRYADSADKQGYYIRANVGGTTPVTLQVSNLAERLFRLLDFTPPDTLPSKLVWAMYDVGLLYTLTSLEAAQDTTGAGEVTTILDQLDLDSSLSQDREQEIVEELEEYDGPDKEDVEQLIDRLQGSGRSAAEAPVAEGSLGLLQRWAEDSDAIPDLLEKYEGYEEFAVASIQTFAKHPRLVAPPVWPQSDGSIKYQVQEDQRDWSIYVYDYRFTEDFDFKVVLQHSNDRKEIAKVAKTGLILDYRNHAGKRGLKMRLASLTKEIIPEKKTLVEVLWPAEMHTSAAIAEYDGEPLEIIREPDQSESENIFPVEVDRISGSGNPVVELGEDHSSDHLLLDQGDVGERFLIEKVSGKSGRVLSRFLTEETE